jgi:hypothetical protein
MVPQVGYYLAWYTLHKFMPFKELELVSIRVVEQVRASAAAAVRAVRLSNKASARLFCALFQPSKCRKIECMCQ